MREKVVLIKANSPLCIERGRERKREREEGGSIMVIFYLLSEEKTDDFIRVQRGNHGAFLSMCCL